ncbi:hypothetical protein PENNAL_c0018G08215 [Penicillium nalgiovense]|uniref:Transcription factor CBF/NF-Y/archaeal histone domain-containing protein n=1 Tax=Penicillium nalgiovense TaxID=60175 RepID=A0A1V6YKC8_PENNA|nr:hypothetical protein PENNAL_c0018G08215 [Penicillium nalgiovense]
MSCVSDTKLHKKQIIAVFSRIRELPTSFSGVNIEHCPVFHFTIFSILLVMTVQKLYPRGTVRRIVKAHSNRSVSKNADILIFLDYILFVQELMREATIRSRKSGEKDVSANTVRKVTEVRCLSPI